MDEQSAAHVRGRRGWVLGAVAATLGGVTAGVWWSGRRADTSVVPPAPELDAFWMTSWMDPGGKAVNVAAMRGKPLLLNFWATWCPPCVEELPMLDAFFAQQRVNGWNVLGLAIDRAEMVQRFLKQNPVRFPVVMGGLGGTELGRALGNVSGGLPFSVVVGANGAIAHRKLGRVTAENLETWAGLK